MLPDCRFWSAKAVSSWNTASVTTMEGMFDGANRFNQAVSSWNTASVTTMEGMFNGGDRQDERCQRDIEVKETDICGRPWQCSLDEIAERFRKAAEARARRDATGFVHHDSGKYSHDNDNVKDMATMNHALKKEVEKAMPDELPKKEICMPSSRDVKTPVGKNHNASVGGFATRIGPERLQELPRADPESLRESRMEQLPSPFFFEDAAKDPTVNTEIVEAYLPSSGAIGLWLEECSDVGNGFKVHGVTPGLAFDGLIEVGDTIVAVNGCIVQDKSMLLQTLTACRPGSSMFTIATSRLPKNKHMETIIRNGYEDMASNAPNEVRNIVLNCEDIGRAAARNRFFGAKSESIIWLGVEEAVKYYQDRGYFVHAVVIESTMSRHPPPKSLSKVLVKSPVMDQCQEKISSDRLFALRLAQCYNCCFVDNWNYRELTSGTSELSSWFQQVGSQKKVEYIFDISGAFLPLHIPD